MGYGVSIWLPLVVMIVFGGVALLLALASLRGSLLAVGLLLLFSCISITRDYDKTIYQTIWLPLQAYRAELAGFFSLIIATSLLVRTRVFTTREVGGIAWCLLAFGIYTGIVRIYHVGFEDGAATALYGVLLNLPLALLVPAMLRSGVTPIDLLKLIVRVGLVMTAMISVQFAVNRHLLVIGMGHRFTALIGNSNQAATMLAGMATCAAWLAVHGPLRSRLFYTAAAAGFVAFLIWTGSRGGALLFLMGLTATFYSRAGRAMILLPAFGLMLVVMFEIASALDIRLVSRNLLEMNDSRSEAWHLMIEGIRDNPWIGVGPVDNRGSENSFLLAWSLYGIGALAILIAMVIAGVALAIRWVRARPSIHPGARPLLDLCIGNIATFFAGSIVEGYLTARVGFSSLTILIFCAIGNWVLLTQRLDPDHAESEHEWSEDEHVVAYGEQPDGSY